MIDLSSSHVWDPITDEHVPYLQPELRRACQAGPTVEGERMSSSGLTPVQAALRFALEVAALVAWGTAAFSVARSATSGEVFGWLAAGVAVLVVAAAWATFRVPGDASASGDAPVPVSGLQRLVLESALLLGAGGAVAATASILFGALLVVLVLGHYVATLDRVQWLLSH